MKKKFFKLCYMIVIILTLSILGVGQSFSASDPDPKITIGDIPGTDSSLLAIQTRKTQAKQMGDKAFRAEIIRAPESVSDLVCLPKLNGNFSGVATLFSDVQDQVNFTFDVNNLCKMALGGSAGFGEDLSGLLKVAATGTLGLSIPALDVCTRPINIGVAFDFGMDGSYSFSVVNQFDLAGCAINASISGGVGFVSEAHLGLGMNIPGYCATFSLPLFECKGIGQFAGEILDFLGVDDTKKILPLVGGGANGGVMFASQDEEISLLGGGKFSLANALGLEQIKAAVGAMTDISLDFDLAFSAGVSSTDGFTSDGGINVNSNAAVTAGTGESYFGAYSGFGADNPDFLTDMQDDMKAMSDGPGAGSLIWNPIPTIGAKLEASAILDLMKLAKDADPTSTPTP